MVKQALKRFINYGARIKEIVCKGNRIGNGVRLLYSNVAKNVFIGNRCNVVHSNIGRYSYLGDNCELPYTKIGSFCSIASHVVLAAGNHPSSFVSTSPAFYSPSSAIGSGFVARQTYLDEYSYVDEDEKYYCEIGNDVWIATQVLLVCGRNALRIGNGAIIRSGSVVTKNVPPYAIVQGVPAHVVGYRFPTETINMLEKVKWYEKDETWLKNHAELFSNVDVFIKKIVEDEGISI